MRLAIGAGESCQPEGDHGDADLGREDLKVLRQLDGATQALPHHLQVQEDLPVPAKSQAQELRTVPGTLFERLGSEHGLVESGRRAGVLRSNTSMWDSLWPTQPHGGDQDSPPPPLGPPCQRDRAHHHHLELQTW